MWFLRYASRETDDVGLRTKAATIDYFSSRLVVDVDVVVTLVDEILHNIYSGVSLALKGPH